MKIAFIIQRYGTEILGGSEYHCRLIAERLAERHDVEVLTTCARDYITWKNEYPEGTDRIRGVTVRRFANARTRDIEAFNRYSDWIFNYPHTPRRRTASGSSSRARGARRSRVPGAHAPAVRRPRSSSPTCTRRRCSACQSRPAKSILVPTAHDEPAIHLGIYREMFGRPAAVAYNTEVEKAFLTTDVPDPGRRRGDRRVRRRPAASRQPRRGVDAPQEGPLAGREDDRRRGPRRTAGTRPPGPWPAPRATGADFRAARRRHSAGTASSWLYGGRIEQGKGCEELFEYFSTYHEAAATRRSR